MSSFYREEAEIQVSMVTRQGQGLISDNSRFEAMSNNRKDTLSIVLYILKSDSYFSLLKSVYT